MKDVSEVMFDWADARALLWNCFFRRRASEGSAGEVVEDFQEVDRALLQSLVCRPLEIEPPRDLVLGATEFERLEVVVEQGPKPAAALLNEQPGGGGGRWRENSEVLRDSGIRLHFVAFFDWDQTGHLANAFCRARVKAHADSPEVVGHDVLIETSKVKVQLTQ